MKNATDYRLRLAFQLGFAHLVHGINCHRHNILSDAADGRVGQRQAHPFGVSRAPVFPRAYSGTSGFFFYAMMLEAVDHR